MNPVLLCRCGVVLWLIAAATSPCCAEESATEARASEAHRVTLDAAALYEFEVATEPSRKLEFHPTPILRWSNPVVGEVYGNVFLWTLNGRPGVVGSIFQWFSPLTHGSHEFQSLAVQPLKGTRDGVDVWTTPRGGIELQSAPDKSFVADSPSIRLRQMRSMSRQVQVRSTDRAGVSRELRLLAQPLYRYGSKDTDILDGGLFVFVQGTDPEVFLVIEARRDGEIWEWQYALARMNSIQFIASFQDREVWRTEMLPWANVKNGREIYTSFGPFQRKEPKP